MTDIGVIPPSKEAMDLVAKLIDRMGITPLPGGVAVCVGVGSEFKAYGGVSMHSRLVFIDCLLGSPGGCAYILALYEEMAIATGALVVVRTASEAAVRALAGGGYVRFSVAQWIRDPLMPRPEATAPEPAPDEPEDELDEPEDEPDEEEPEEEAEEEVEEEAPKPPPKPQGGIKPRLTSKRGKKGKRKRR